jgi:hypothetical protein
MKACSLVALYDTIQMLRFFMAALLQHAFLEGLNRAEKKVELAAPAVGDLLFV